MLIPSHKGVKKIIKTFLSEDFFHLPPVYLELRISPQIFEKIRNSPKASGAWGKLIHKKT